MRWLSAIIATLVTVASQGQSFGDALDGGQAAVELRYRYEFVDQEGFFDNANASTLRGRLNWRSGQYSGFDIFVEFDAVATILVDDYNSAAGTSSARRDRYPVVADPDYTEVNQLYLRYSAWKDTELRLGRQRILLDNQRFVGGVGWRQNEQTYDAVSIDVEPGNGVRLFYSYVDNVNRIFGDDVSAGDNDSSTHLVNASKAFGDAGTLTGYYYGIDNQDAAGASTDTIGLRFAGAARWMDKPATYLLEFARQSDRADNPVDYDADYWRIEGSLALTPLKLHAGYEVLGGESSRAGAAFRTPLATLHAFNGWADQFLATPDTGLTDAFVGLSGQADAWSWKALVHFFDSDATSASYGEELDVSIGRKFGKQYSVLFKAAHFDADNPGFADTTKLWLMFTMTGGN